MKTIKIRKQESHSYRLVAVASENLGGKKPSDIEYLEDDESKYFVVSFYTYKRTDIFPEYLFLLATGQYLTPEQIWKSFKKSEKIYIFVCDERT